MKKYSVLLVHCHDIGRHLGCYGINSVASENIDAFAGEGVRFAQSFCTAPSCSPARASLFTGRYPHCTGVMGLCHNSFGWDLNSGERHLAGFLKKADYSTAAAGITHEISSDPKKWGYDFADGKLFAEEVTNSAIQKLREFRGNKEKPFFMSVGFLEPHRLPAETTGGELGMIMMDHDFLGIHIQPDESLGLVIPGYLKDTPGTRRELAELQGAIRHVDQQFGRIMETLRVLGLEESTLVIFTSDHGIAMPRSKCTLYEPGVSVPLILRLPEREGWHGGKIIPHMVSTMDITPSILSLTGLSIPHNIHGKSFTALLDGKSYKPRSCLFTEMTYHDYYDPRRAVRTERYKLIANLSTAPFAMDPSQSWRPRSDVMGPNLKAAYHDYLELYDLRDDPYELRNLTYDSHYEAIQKLLCDLLFNYMQETEDPILKGAVISPQHTAVVSMLQNCAD